MEKSRSCSLVILAFAILITQGHNVWAEDGDGILSEDFESNILVLTAYVDEDGKALVTGYAQDIVGLPFLESSQYQYENETGQIYAITNSLTWKYGDDWETKLEVDSYYDEYQATFYLPGDAKLNRIEGSEGLEYLVAASNDSFVVEFHGYDIQSPSISIGYSRSILKDPGGELNGELDGGLETEVLDEDGNFPIQILFIVLAFAALAVFIAIEMEKKKKEMASRPAPKEQLDKMNEMNRTKVPAQTSEDVTKSSKISSEMVAVMETLTEREQSILKTLIEHNGKMTQADIRYETGIPKSSLTGIIISLERRKIVTKREWGRTNVIEISERLKFETDQV